MKRRIWSAILAVAMLLTLLPTVAWAAEPQTKDGHTYVPISKENNVLFNQRLADRLALMLAYGGDAALLSTGSNMAGAKLTGNAKIAYDTVAAQISNIAQNGGSTIFTLSDDITLTWDDAEDAYYALWYDYPYEFYWRGGQGYDYDDNLFMIFVSGDYNVSGKPSDNIEYGKYETYTDYCFVDPAKAKAVSDKVAAASWCVQTILDGAKNEGSNFEKLAYFKDEICELVSYNSAALEGDSLHEGDPWQLIWVFDGDPSTDVACEGYAKAFQYLCDLMWPDGEVQCYSVIGNMNGGNHMWNIVTLGGSNYLVDVTNCDNSGMSMKEAPDNWLFMVGQSGGDVSEGYSVYIPRTITLHERGASVSLEHTIEYKYIEQTLGTWPEGVLTLSEADYNGDPYLIYSAEPTALSIGDEVNLTATLKNAGSGYTFSLIDVDYNKPLPDGLQLDPETGNITGAVTTSTTESARVLIQATKEGADPINTCLFFPIIYDHVHNLDGTWGWHDTRHWHPCTICGAELERAPHTKTTSISKAVTCTEDGEQVTSCSVCGWSKTETIPANHSWGIAVETTPATYTTPGVKTKTCSACGATVTEEIPQLQHTFGGWEKDDISHWQVCNCTNTGHGHTQFTTAKAPHTWNDGETTKEPTTTEAGVKTFTCTVCGQTKAETLPKLDTPTPQEHKHQWNTSTWEKNAIGHWHNCVATGCDITENSKKNGYGVHIYDSDFDASCNICDYIRTITSSTPSDSGSTVTPSDGGSFSSGTTITPSTSSLPVTTEIVTDNGKSINETTAVPTATVKDNASVTTVDTVMGDEIVKQAISNSSENVVIAPKVKGNVTKAEVSISVSTVAKIGQETNATLTVATPVANVTISNEALSNLPKAGSSVVVSVGQTSAGVDLSVNVDNKAVENVPGGITVSVPVATITPGTVAVLVHEDGTRETVRKSLAVDGTVIFSVSGSAKVEIVDNGKQFSDVAADNWASNAVAFVSAHELFNGTGAGNFSPDLPMSRGMLAVVLHNLESNPDQAVTNVFADVNNNDWYAEGIAWAAAEGIVGGYGNGLFGPDDNITREQFAVMLWRYAGEPATAKRELPFTDTDMIGNYALDAVRWAVEDSVINGKGSGILDPKGFATRAQAAQMLKNYLERGI